MQAIGPSETGGDKRADPSTGAASGAKRRQGCRERAEGQAQRSREGPQAVAEGEGPAAKGPRRERGACTAPAGAAERRTPMQAIGPSETGEGRRAGTVPENAHSLNPPGS
ncbi:MAG: hypothetical protein Kow00128_23940 [Deltaproteobacteria bacterium]